MALKSIRPIQPTAATMPSKAVAPMTPAAPKTPLSQVGDIRGHFLPGLPVIGADKQKDAGSRDIDRNTAPKKDLPYAWQQMTKFMPSQAVNPNAKNEEDKRTPEQLLDFIEAKGREIAEALAVLRG